MGRRINSPTTESRSTNESNVENNIDESALNSDDDSLGAGRYRSRISDDDSTISQSKGLLPQSSTGVRRLENGGSRHSFDDHDFDVRHGFRGSDVVGQLFDRCDSLLRVL